MARTEAGSFGSFACSKPLRRVVKTGSDEELYWSHDLQGNYAVNLCVHKEFTISVWRVWEHWHTQEEIRRGRRVGETYRKTRKEDVQNFALPADHRLET